MALYLISYDINEKDAFEYGGLWERLRELGAVRILYSEWILADSANRSPHIYDEVATLIQDKDRLLVHEVTSDAVWDKLLIPNEAFEKLLSKARS